MYVHCNIQSCKGNIPAVGANTMPADALGPKVARAPANMALAVQDRQHVLLFQS